MTNLAICTQIDNRLDELEEKLPPLAANIVSVNRAIWSRTTRDLGRLGSMLSESAGAFATAAGVSMRTVNGTAKWAAERTVDTATTGVRQTIGQAKAQTKITVDAASEELDDLAEMIDPEVEAVPSAGDFETWSKADLYDRAQELDINGRSSMTKAELVVALRA